MSVPNYELYGSIDFDEPRKKRKGKRRRNMLRMGTLLIIAIIIMALVSNYVSGSSEASVFASTQVYVFPELPASANLDIEVDHAYVDISGIPNTDTGRVEVTQQFQGRTSGFGQGQFIGQSIEVDKQIDEEGSHTIIVRSASPILNKGAIFARPAYIRILVPQTMNINVINTGGNVNLQNVTLNEPALIQTTFGNIYLDDLITSGSLEVRTNQGEIRMVSVEANGELTVDTSFGSIFLNHVIARLGGHFSTVGGSLILDDVTLQGDNQTQYVLESTSGRLVVLGISEDSRVRIDATASKVDNYLQLTSDSTLSASEVVGCYNAGQITSDGCGDVATISARISNARLQLGNPVQIFNDRRAVH